MKKVIIAAITAILLSLIVGSLFVLNPNLFDNQTPSGLTTVSISQINVSPQGLAVSDSGSVSGGYWNILVYVNSNDNLAGVILPEGQKTSITYNGATKALETGAKIEIKIDPQQPYIIRTLQEKTVMIAPGATGQSTVQPLYLNYYSWNEPTWRIYTPFVVSIYKDGSIVGQKTINMQGASQVQTIDTTEGTVRIENLGILGGQYLSPNTPSQIAIFKGAPNVYDWTQIYNKIDGTTTGSGSKYADYWYGISRNSANQAINPTMTIGGILSTAYKPSAYGGWSGSDYSGSATPIRPVLYTGDKSSLPNDERGFYCLTEWIQSKSISNLASSIFNTKATGDNNALWQSASFVTDTNGQTALRLDVPWSAFGTPLVSFKVPTELADTWVEQPLVTQTEVSAKWVATNSKYAELQGSQRIAVTLTNKGTVTGGTLLEAQTGNSKLSVTPLSMTVNNLVPNVPQTVYFDCSNLGVQNQIDDIPVTIIAKDTYMDSETGRDTVYGTLLPTLTTGTTTLTVRAVEKGTNNGIVGLQLQVTLPGREPFSVFTGAGGSTGPVTLATPQGGAFTGDVQITSLDSVTYHAAYLTYHVASASAYGTTLEIERKDTVYPEPTFDWWLYVIIGIIVTVIVLIVVAVALSKRKPTKRRS